MPLTLQSVDLLPTLLWPGFTGTTLPGWVARELDRGLAGVVLFARNIESPAQVRALAAEIRQHNPHALIAADEEGGTVTRLEAAGGSTLPGAGALGAVDDPAVTEAVGRELGRRCLAVGIDVVLGPVADVNTNPANPVIGVRSFAADPDTVARHVAACVRGITATGAACCLKHFPGHGDTTADSHHALPVSGATAETQDSVHLPPFLAGIAAGAPMVMSAHVVVPHLGPEPATCNPAALALLRGAGFAGVICSDALEMAAIAEGRGIARGAADAVAAGCDLLCLGNPSPGADEAQYGQAYAGLAGALAEGRLEPARVAEAAGRVRALQDALAGATAPPGPAPDFAAVAMRALSGDLPPVSGALLVADLRHRVNMAAGEGGDRFTAALREAGARVRRVAPRPEAYAAPEPEPDETLLLVTDDLRPGSWQRGVRDALGDPPTIHAGLPVDAPGVLCTRDGSRVAARAAATRVLCPAAR